MNSFNELSYALDTFYLLVCGALVMWMAAGFTMLEAGLVRAKNTTSILTKNIALYSLASVTFLISGYQIMYGTPVNAFVPGFGTGVGEENGVAAVLSGASDAPHFSVMADFFFQVVFVATAMSIVSGAIAERMKLWSFLVFVIVLSGFIYPVQGYWQWGGGFLKQMGFADFAGSGVVHVCGAAAALAAVLLVGPRAGRYDEEGRVRAMPGANMPLATLGTLILWFGWFGFNGGSELRISDVNEANAVARIFVNTNMAAAGGAIASLCAVRLFSGKSDLTMILNGVIAGLVSITAEPLCPSPLIATAIGGGGGVVVVASITLLDRLKIDDSVGAISAHGSAGLWGLGAVALSNPEASLVIQLLGGAVIFSWVFVTSLVAWWIINRILGLRVTENEETSGLDAKEYGVKAYPEFSFTAFRPLRT